MENKVNNAAYNLIDRLVIKVNESVNKEPSELIGSVKERGFIDMSSKTSGTSIGRTVSFDDILIDISYSDGSSEMVIGNELLQDFNSLINDIQSLDYINNKASDNFIEDKSLEWLFGVKKNATAQQSLIEHIKTQLDDAVKDYEFFFPVTNLNIKQPFKIGNVEFTYFTKDYMDKLYEKYNTTLKPLSVEEFDTLYRNEYQGIVIAKTSANGESAKAGVIAKRNAELSIDVLKIILLTTNPSNKLTFELNHRLNYQMQSKFLSKQNNEHPYLITMNFGNSGLFTYNNEYQKELMLFSGFIMLKHTDELYHFIINAIEMFSFSLSISDKHKRVISLITLLESLLLEEERTRDLEGKSKTRLSKVLTDVFSEKENIKTLFSGIYKIRHKMVHKAIRLPINTKELYSAQLHILSLIIKLIDININKKIQDKQTLLTTLDAQVT